MTAYFVSDVHLDPARPDVTDCFLDFLKTDVAGAESLYILGDLFDVWIGDDNPEPHDARVLSAIGELSAAGTAVSFIRGNRDFLLGPASAAHAGMEILDDGTLINVAGTPAMIMHGDILCTDDRAYQRFRKVVRSGAVQRAFRSLPAGFRRSIAAYARRRSSAANAGKPAYIMDVNEQAVVETLRNAAIDTLIHGHTHRPAIHAIDTPELGGTRIVLGDWYQQGSFLIWNESGYDLKTCAF